MHTHHQLSGRALFDQPAKERPDREVEESPTAQDQVDHARVVRRFEDGPNGPEARELLLGALSRRYARHVQRNVIRGCGVCCRRHFWGAETGIRRSVAAAADVWMCG